MGGPIIAGNFREDRNSTGFCQVCKDPDVDAICDEQYVFDNANIDYLPLTVNNKKSGSENIK